METNSETGSQTPPTTAVIEAIADYEGLAPLDLDHPLAEVIDTDALDSIIDHGDATQASDITVQFSYNGCRVQVSNDGSVEVRSSRSE